MDKLAEQIGALLEKLGIAATEAWPHIVMAYWAKNLIGVLVSIAMLLIGPILLRLCFKNGETANKADYSESGFYVFKTAVFGLVGSLLCLIGVLTLTQCFYGVVDPAGALLLDVIKR